MDSCCLFTLAACAAKALTPTDSGGDAGTCTYRASFTDAVCGGSATFKIYCSGGVWKARITIVSPVSPVGPCYDPACPVSPTDFWEATLTGCVGPCPPTGTYTMTGDPGNYCSLDCTLVIS